MTPSQLQQQLRKQIKTTQSDGTESMEAAHGAVELLSKAARVAAFQYRMYEALNKAAPKINAFQKHNYGALVYIRVNNCEDGGPLFGGLDVVGGGGTPWQAYQSYRPSIWNDSDCGGEIATLWLWFTPFGMSVESPESIRASADAPKMEAIRQSIQDAIDKRYGARP